MNANDADSVRHGRRLLAGRVPASGRGRFRRALLLVLALVPAGAVAQEAVQWTPIVTGPGYPLLAQARYGHAWVYDAPRRRMVIYGGFYGGYGDFLHSLDLQNGTGWSPVHIANAPLGGRAYASAIFDSKRSRMMIFGGYGGGDNPALNQVLNLQLYGLPAWQLYTTNSTTLPSPRWAHCAIYDPVRDRMLVFGGYNPTDGYLGDLWQLTLYGTPGWTRLAPAGETPSPRDGATAVFDRQGDRMILFGGNAGGVANDEVWALSLGGTPAWTRLAPTGTPPSARFFHAAAVDSATHSMLVFGGYDGQSRSDCWRLSLDGATAWSEVPTTGGPPAARHSPAAIYDPVRRQLVCYGGRDEAAAANLGDTPVLSFAAGGANWALTQPSPFGRVGAMAVYDSLGDRFLLTGGHTAEGYYDAPGAVWQLTGRTPHEWTLLSPGGSGPPQRDYHALFIDGSGTRLWQVSGMIGSYGLGDVSSLSLAAPETWTRHWPPGPAPVQGNSAWAYDTRRNGLWLYSGIDRTSLVGGLWFLALDGTPAWTKVTPLGTGPSARSGARAIYDRERDRVLIHGGMGGSSPNTALRDDLWFLDLSPVPAWSQPPVTWHSRAYETFVEDRARRRFVVFGGFSVSETNALYAASLADPVAWHEPVLAGGLWPTGRYFHAGAYDSRRDRLLVFGGTAIGWPYKTDAWFANFLGLPVATLASLVEWDASPALVHIVWSVTGGRDEVPIVRRRRGEVEWTVVSRALPDGSARLVLDDTDVRPGEACEYAVRLPGEVLAGRVEIDVPGTSRLALSGFAPNPARGRPAVRFSLADGSPAVLRLLDVSGRCVGEQEVGSLGAGTHVVPFDRGAGLRPGVYLVQLVQGGQSVVARSCLIR